MKGQSAVFEEVLLFGIGVGIFLAIFFIFSGVQQTSLETTSRDHLTEVMNYLSSYILDISTTEGNVSIILPLTDRIDDDLYTIILNSTGLHIKMENKGILISNGMYGIQKGGIAFKENEIASVSKKIMIYKKGNEIGITAINI